MSGSDQTLRLACAFLTAADKLVEAEAYSGAAMASADFHLEGEEGWVLVARLCEEAKAGRGVEASRQVHRSTTTPVFVHKHGDRAQITFFGPEFNHVDAQPGSREWTVLQTIADAERAAGRSTA